MPDNYAPTEQTGINPEQLNAFVTSLVRLRDKAIEGRKASGIETDWLEDEEFYQGIDDANRQAQTDMRTLIGAHKICSVVRCY